MSPTQEWRTVEMSGSEQFSATFPLTREQAPPRLYGEPE